MEQFERAVTGRVYTGKVREDLQSGMESGVHGNPTYFINEVRHNDSGELDVLLEAVERKTNEVTGREKTKRRRKKQS